MNEPANIFMTLMVSDLQTNDEDSGKIMASLVR